MALQSQDAVNWSAKRLEAYSCSFWAKTAKRADATNTQKARTPCIERFFFYRSYRSMIPTICDLQWYCMISCELWYTTYIAHDNIKISELQALLSSALAMSMAWASNTSSSPWILHQTIACRPGPSSSCLYPRPEGARFVFRAGNEDFQQLHHQQWSLWRTPKAPACMRNINLSCLALCMVKACRILSA